MHNIINIKLIFKYINKIYFIKINLKNNVIITKIRNNIKKKKKRKNNLLKKCSSKKIYN